MNERERFWTLKLGWPRDPLGFVFLARAVHEIGCATFKEWTGSEPATVLLLSLPLKAAAKFSDLARADDLLRRHCPQFGRKAPVWHKSPFGGSFPPTIKFSVEEWAEAVRLAKLEYEKTVPLVRRFGTVQEIIGQQCEAGALVSAYRVNSTGQMFTIPRQWWNTERLSNRFTLCEINPREPMGLGFAGDGYCPIFLIRESLDAFLETKAKSNGAAAMVADAGSLVLSGQATECILQAAADRWPIPVREPASRTAKAAWLAMKKKWGAAGGVPRNLSFQQVADDLSVRGGVSRDTVRRVLKEDY